MKQVFIFALTLLFILTACSSNYVKHKNLVASVTYEDYHKKNYTNADKNKENITEETNDWNASIDIKLIKVNAPDPVSSKQINQFIDSIVCEQGGTKNNSINGLLNSVDSGEFNLEITCALVTNENNILCIMVSNDFYGFGAAHGSSISNYYNFEILTGKQITLKDILLSGYKNKLDRIGERKFIETNGSDDWDFEKGKFELNNDFAIKPDGLVFSFDSYEIGSYANGSPEVFIAYKDINDLIDPNGLIGQRRTK